MHGEGRSQLGTVAASSSFHTASMGRAGEEHRRWLLLPGNCRPHAFGALCSESGRGGDAQPQLLPSCMFAYAIHDMG